MATAETTTQTATEPIKKKRKPGPGRPTAENAGPIKEAKQNRFFEAVNSVPPADWGTRVVLWLYRLEPFTDRRRSGEHIYLMQYLEAVNEQRVMADFGSGRYRLMLTFRKPGAERGDEMDKYEFEINNQQYPPKIAPGEWVDDSRNIKWAWAKPLIAAANAPAAPPPQAAAPNVLETLQVFNEITDSVTERMKPAAGEVKPQGDPIDLAVKIVGLMKGGGETALLQMMADDMKALRAENMELQQEARRINAPAAPVDPLAAMSAQFENFKKMKELFAGSKEEQSGGVEEAITRYARSKMPAWMEFLQPAVPAFLQAMTPITTALAHKMLQPAPQTQTHSPAPPSTPQSIPPPKTQPTEGAPQQTQRS